MKLLSSGCCLTDDERRSTRIRAICEKLVWMTSVDELGQADMMVRTGKFLGWFRCALILSAGLRIGAQALAAWRLPGSYRLGRALSSQGGPGARACQFDDSNGCRLATRPPNGRWLSASRIKFSQPRPQWYRLSSNRHYQTALLAVDSSPPRDRD